MARGCSHAGKLGTGSVMAIGDWSEEDVKNGLRSPTGGLVGGLVVLDYIAGRADFAAGTPPPTVTSASYDLGRRRAAEDAEERADFIAKLQQRNREANERVRAALKDRHELLEEYDRNMAAIHAKHAVEG